MELGTEGVLPGGEENIRPVGAVSVGLCRDEGVAVDPYEDRGPRDRAVVVGREVPRAGDGRSVHFREGKGDAGVFGQNLERCDV